jgi:predicted nucleotidyltransferase
MEFDNYVEEFIRSASKHNVRMIMVGGTAVNFHGYQRHSADVDFWIEITNSNLNALKEALNSIGYEFTNFPDEVKNGLQNISLKISPYLEIELITRFSLNKQFSEVYGSSSEAKIPGTNISYRVLALEDLITSKALSGRNKDLLDIQELKRINKIT